MTAATGPTDERRLDAAALDAVLQDAVAAGGVPHVAAIVADRDGVLYEGAAGPRDVGERRPADHRHPVPAHVDDQDGHPRPRRCSIETGELTSTRRSTRTAPSSPPSGARRLRRRHPATAATGRSRDRPQLMTHTAGLGYWFWNADLVRWHDVSGVPNVVAGLHRFTPRRWSSTPVLRSYTASTPTGWARSSRPSPVRARPRGQESITGPLGMDRRPGSARATVFPDCTPVHVRGEDGTGRRSVRCSTRTPSGGRAGTGLLAPPGDYIRFQRALLRGGGARRRPHPGGGDRRCGVHQPDRRARRPAAHADGRPRLQRDWRPGPGRKWGLGLLINTTTCPGCAAPARARGRGCATPVLDRPHGGHLRLRSPSNFLPFITPAAVKVYEDVERAVYAGR